MAGDRQQFKLAKTKWAQLLDEQVFGAPIAEGKVAIATSPFTDEPADTVTGMSELASFHSEALQIAERCRARGQQPVLAIDATRSELGDLIADPRISTVFVIGNGALSNLMLGEKDYFDWSDVAEATTHLKQGSFVQRQCGGLSRATNVPLGMFAVADHREVFAALGNDSFNPRSLDDPENDCVRRVFETADVTYDDVKALSGFEYTSTARTTNGEESVELSIDELKVFRDYVLAARRSVGAAPGFSDIVPVRTVKERFGFDLVEFLDRWASLCGVDTDRPEVPGPAHRHDSNLEATRRLFALALEECMNAPFLTKPHPMLAS